MVKAIITFLVICACGAITILAGGIQWGTPECGIVAGITSFLACLMAMAATLADD